MKGLDDRRPARVELTIGALELSGFPASQRFAIAGAVEQALGDLLAAQDWPTEGASSQREAHASATFDARADHGTVGRAIAQAIFVAAGPATTARRSP